jgi:hypothetical protein
MDMQYSDELIKQELKRYAITNSPDISEDEIARWKETFVDLDNEKIQSALEYIHGRSWYWRKLMQSADMPANSKVDEVMTQIEALKVLHSEFEIGIQIAMRLLGKPIEGSKIQRLKDSNIEYSENNEPIELKPKRKSKKKA